MINSITTFREEILQLSQDDIEDKLSNWPVARLATSNIEGQPHQVPIVFVWSGGYLWSPVDGKPKRNKPLVRIQNALQNPCASVLLDHYDEDWSSLWWLRVDVNTQVVRLNELHGQAKINADCAIKALLDKYHQYLTTAIFTDTPTLLMMKPTFFSSWRAG
jgi:PPOX class probable F420-dependent enzyme